MFQPREPATNGPRNFRPAVTSVADQVAPPGCVGIRPGWAEGTECPVFPSPPRRNPATPHRHHKAPPMHHPPTPAPRGSISVLLEFAKGTSGMMATIRATPLFWRLHDFGTLGSAEPLGEHEMVVRQANAAPVTHLFPPIDLLCAELEASQPKSRTAQPQRFPTKASWRP